MSTTATLIYNATAPAPLTNVALAAAMAAVALDTGAMANFGAVLASDSTTTVGGTGARRTIVFTISSAQFNENFPSGTSQQATPFKNLYTHALAGATGVKIMASPPVIA